MPSSFTMKFFMKIWIEIFRVAKFIVFGMLFALLLCVAVFFTELLVRKTVTPSWVQEHREQGSCSGSLHCWPSDSLGWASTFTSGGQNHHISTPRRADWKLIKNVGVQWMTGSFCWSSALTEQAGRSRVPGAGEPHGGLHHCLAAKLMSYQQQHINEAAVLFVQMVITTSIFLCIKTIPY